MPVQQLRDIFLGMTPGPARAYLLKAFKDLKAAGYQTVHFPGVGRFACVEPAIEAGFHPRQIYASDISLFSSLLGYHCSGLPQPEVIERLGVRFGDRFRAFDRYLDTDEAIGAVLLAMKIGQLRANSHYERPVYEELLRNPDEYVSQLARKAAQLKARMDGLHYAPRDLMEHIRTAGEDPQAIVYSDPPLASGGYEKMWGVIGTDLFWDAPAVQNFDPKTMLEEHDATLLDARALTMVYRPGGKYGGLPGALGAKTAFANTAGGRADFVASNRPQELPLIVVPPKPSEIGPVAAPVMPRDHEITVDSKVTIQKTTAAHAFYYRDLFAHKLGTTNAEGLYLMLIDGYVFGVFGMMYSHMTRGQSPHVFEVFGFNVPSDRYPRLNRLLMSILVSNDCRKFFARESKATLLEPEEFRTTCIASGPEVKANRGLLEIRERWQRPDGRYHIVYVTKFKSWTFREAIKAWLGKMKHQEKATGRKLGAS